MTELLQQTVAKPIVTKGIGVHSGKAVTLKILPANEDTGIVFVRTDLPSNKTIKAIYKNVVDTKLCTVIANEHGAKVGTIEHLMSALWGCGIDNAIIEVDAEEVPIMDGSAEPFVNLIAKAGTRKQDKQRNFIKVTKPLRFEIDGKFIELSPADEFEVEYKIDFEHKTIGSQVFSFASAKMCFNRFISRARTYGFLKDVNWLRSIGLAKGASLDNAVGIDDEGIMNKEGLRYNDEFVRHKILDCIGDLYLSGTRIIGKVSAYKAGHQLHYKILEMLFANPQNYVNMPSGLVLFKIAKAV